MTQATGNELTFIRVPKGEFVRRDDDAAGSKDQKVEPTHDFWLSDREVSVGLFQQFVDSVGAAGSEYRKQCPVGEIPDAWEWTGKDEDLSLTEHHPVQHVSWDDAVRFCNWLSRLEKRPDWYVWDTEGWKKSPQEGGYRLPTAAEWEHACRAGTGTKFSFGHSEEILTDYGWYHSNSESKAHPIGSKMPNACGLHDMHGNVWEWCQDWHGAYSTGPNVDPTGPETGTRRVSHGGCFYNPADECLSSIRSLMLPGDGFRGVGFRVARN